MDLELNNQETTNYIFEIVLIPDMRYKITSVNIPGTSIGIVDSYPSFVSNRIDFPGDSISFDDLNVTFIVDKKLNNYYYIFYWMKEIIKTNRLQEIDTNLDPVIQELVKREFSDAILFIYTGERLDRKIRFKNIFPYQLGEISFSSTDEYKLSTCTVSFKYEEFDFED